MKKVWIYENVLNSVSDEDIGRRMKKIRDYAVKNDLNIVGESIDKHSITKDFWQEFERAVDAVRSKTADAILVYHVMTLGHDEKTMVEKSLQITQAGGGIISVEEGQIDAPIAYFLMGCPRLDEISLR